MPVALPTRGFSVWCRTLKKLSSGQLVHPEPFDHLIWTYPEGYSISRLYRTRGLPPDRELALANVVRGLCRLERKITTCLFNLSG